MESLNNTGNLGGWITVDGFFGCWWDDGKDNDEELEDEDLEDLQAKTGDADEVQAGVWEATITTDAGSVQFAWERQTSSISSSMHPILPDWALGQNKVTGIFVIWIDFIFVNHHNICDT